VTRDDLIVGFLGEYQRRREKTEEPFEAALVICGRKDKYQVSHEVLDMIKSCSGPPVMMVEHSSHDVTKAIHGYTPKLNIHDSHRVDAAIQHYEPYIDFNELARRTRSSNSSFNDPSTISLDDLRML